MAHAGKIIEFKKSMAGHVERDIVVAFDRVVTVPVVIDGRKCAAYVGVTKIGRFAGGSASNDDLVEVASRLDWASD